MWSRSVKLWNHASNPYAWFHASYEAWNVLLMSVVLHKARVNTENAPNKYSLTLRTYGKACKTKSADLLFSKVILKRDSWNYVIGLLYLAWKRIFLVTPIAQTRSGCGKNHINHFNSINSWKCLRKSKQFLIVFGNKYHSFS